MVELLELHQLADGISQTNFSSRFWRKCTCPYLGIVLATFSSFFFSLCSVIVKGLVDVNPIELASYRFVGVLLPAIPIFLSRKHSIFPEGKRIILLLRCFVGSTGLMLSFYAFRHMPLADASVIIFSTPVFAALFARLFLREPCGLFNIMTVLLTLIGVVLITRPQIVFGDSAATLVDQPIIDENANIWGPVAAFSATLFSANAYVLLRALKDLHFSVVMTHFGVFALIYTIFVSWLLGTLCWPTCGIDRVMIVLLAVFSFLGQIMLTLSLQVEQAGSVALARSADIVFAFAWQVLLFNEEPNLCSIIGALLVISSVMLIGFRRWVLSFPRESTIRNRARFIIME